MKVNQRLALLKEWHKSFRSLINGIDPDSLSTLSGDQQNVLKDIVHKLHRDIRNIKGLLSDSLFEEGSVMFQADPDLIRYYRENIIRDEELIAIIFEKTNSDLFELFRLFDSPGRLQLGHISRTFQVGMEKMDQLLEEYPEFEDEYMVEHAWDLMDSELIRFEPDKWIENSRLLQPIMTDKQQRLPVHVRFRLEELYRSFIFENWLAAISLSRATLEYAILDNCHKLGIEPKYTITYPKEQERAKDLKVLIDEISEYNNELSGFMDFIRDEGNQVIHPKKTTMSREKLFERKDSARKCIEKLTHVIEALYLPKTLV